MGAVIPNLTVPRAKTLAQHLKPMSQAWADDKIVAVDAACENTKPSAIGQVGNIARLKYGPGQCQVRY